MPIPRPDLQGDRVIAHVDMDCFYVQVEQRKQPKLRGLPTAVVQYNDWKGGALIAVSYEARKFGVKRSMRGADAEMVCPSIQLVQVPVARGKADLNAYRSAGSEVVSILSTKGRCERASIDEVYLDLTDAAESMLSETPLEVLEDIDEEALKSHVLGLNGDEEQEKNVRGWFFRSDAIHQDKLLACGAIIVAELRGKVLKETEFTCSAGIAHNKVVTDNASAYKAAGRRLMEKRQHMYWTPCAAHCLDLILERLGDLPQHRHALGKAKKISKFIYNHSWVLALMRKFSKNELLRLATTRFATAYLTLQSMLDARQPLEAMFTSSQWLQSPWAKKAAGKEVRKIVLSDKFWTTVSYAIRSTKPLVQMLAKLASGMHKPAQQTIVPSSAVKDLLASLPVKKMKQLGGKLGSSLQDDLGVNTVGDLLKFSEEKLQEQYGFNTGTWLWNIARGISGDEVKGRVLPKSHGCGKTFPGPRALKTTADVESWLNQLCEELSERIQLDLDQNKRVAHTLTLHARAFKKGDIEPHKKFPSKSCQLRYGTNKIQEDAKKLFDTGLREFLGSHSFNWKVTSLAISASKILDTPGTSSILRFFHGKSYSSDDIQDHTPSSSLGCKGNMLAESDEDQRVFPHEKSVKEDGAPSHDRRIDDFCMQNRKHKDKGNGSILRFFSGINASTKQASNEIMAPSSVSERHEGQEQRDLEEERAVDEHSRLGRISDGSWNFNAEDIDPSVIGELPPEIQREVRGWIRSSKRVKTAKRGSNIFHYFSTDGKS